VDIPVLMRWRRWTNAEPLAKKPRERERRRGQRVLLFTLALASFGAVVVGGPTVAGAVPNISASSPPPACSLLSNDEVAHALAMKVQTRTADPYPGRVIPGSECEWQSVPFGNFTSVSAGLDLDVAHLSCAEFKRSFNNARKQGHHVLPYKGIGEVAYLEPDGNGSYELSVCQKGVVVQSSAWRVDSPLATEKALTRAILNHLEALANV
jgi:hypothetical protein